MVGGKLKSANIDSSTLHVSAGNDVRLVGSDLTAKDELLVEAGRAGADGVSRQSGLRFARALRSGLRPVLTIVGQPASAGSAPLG